MPTRSLFLPFFCLLLFAVACTHDQALPEDPIDTGLPCSPDVVYFPLDVLPILEGNCAFGGCHDADTRAEGIQLDSYVNVITTGEVKPGKPQDSELYEVITETDNDKRMPPPPYAPLSDAQKAIIEKWILQGAKNLTCTPQGSCNTTNVSFAATVVPILETGCLGCHGAEVYQIAGDGINLSGYDAVKVVAQNGKLFGSINHSSGFSPMPKGGSKLPNCQINQIKSWIDAGAPNN